MYGRMGILIWPNFHTVLISTEQKLRQEIKMILYSNISKAKRKQGHCNISQNTLVV